MTRPKPPRLPELAGMTEAGFNRVKGMIRWEDFAPRDSHGRICGADFLESWNRYQSWVKSLPKVRNKKQRKADAKRTALHERAREAWTEAFGAPPPDMRTPLQRLQKFAADTGVPVSFEIAEAAMKGGG